MDLYTLLIIFHVVGSVLGVGGATMIEANLRVALRDGKMSPDERPFMASAVFVTRVGMLLAFLTGLGFIASYIFNDQLSRIANGVFWAKMTMFVVIVVNAYLLAKHWVGLYWGSALSFVSWWGTLLAGLFLTNGVRIYPQDQLVSFIVVMAVYTAAIVCGAWALHRVRSHNSKEAVSPQSNSKPPTAATQSGPIVQTADEALGRVKPADAQKKP